jgi:hypothetical protein
MSYTVDWLPDAEQSLAAAWLAARDRAAVTRAANVIDERLRHDPGNEGESRPDGRRIMFVAPLGVIFRVLPNERRVIVSHLWQFTTHAG